MLLSRFPRVALAAVPTPLEEMVRLREAVGGPRIFIKRDDNTGLALGGNKARKLEFLLGDALAHQADTVITTGGVQSNHARMTVAAARKFGLHPVLVLEGDDPGNRRGNLLLDELMGADIRFVQPESAEGLDRAINEVAAEFEEAGRRPYVIPVGGSTPVGSLGYVAAMTELTSQLNERALAVTDTFVAAGSGGTEAGMLLGSYVNHMGARLHCISVSRQAERLRNRIVELAHETATLVGTTVEVQPGDLLAYDEYVGPGYAIPTPEGLDTIRLLARTEGILLDPVYTGKAFAGMLDLVRRGLFDPDDVLLFYHTGGTPALFAMEHYFFSPSTGGDSTL